jgi:hypothetical protein
VEGKFKMANSEKQFYDVLGKPLAKGDLIVYMKTYRGSKAVVMRTGIVESFAPKSVRVRPFIQQVSPNTYPLCVHKDALGLDDEVISKFETQIVKVEYPT